MEDKLFDESRYFLSKGNKSYFLYDSKNGDYFCEDNLFEVVNRLKMQKEKIKSKIDFSDCSCNSSCNITNLKLFDFSELDGSFYQGDFIDNGMNLLETKKVIDYVFEKYSQSYSDYCFVLKMYSDSSFEFDRILQIKNYLDKKTSLFFNCSDFNSFSDLKNFFCELPGGLFDNTDFNTEKEGLDLLNSILLNKNMICFFFNSLKKQVPTPLLKMYINRNNLSDNELVLLNRRFLEFVFPDIIDRKPGYSLFININDYFYSNKLINFLNQIKVEILYFNISLSINNNLCSLNDEYYKEKRIIKNLQLYEKAGKKVFISTSIPKNYPYPLQILNYFNKIGISYINMYPHIIKNEIYFSRNYIENLLNGYKSLYLKLKSDIVNNNYSTVSMLSNDLSVAGLKLINNASVNISTINENVRLKIENDEIITSSNDFNDNIQLYYKKRCNLCWNKYICKNTQIFNQFCNKENLVFNEIECFYIKELISLSLGFMHNLIENSINITSLLNELSIKTNNQIEDRCFYISNGIEKEINCSVQNFKQELYNMYKHLKYNNIKYSDEIYFFIYDGKSEKKELNIKLVLPIENKDNKNKDFNYVKDLKVTNFISTNYLINDIFFNNQNIQIYKKNKIIPISKNIWYKGNIQKLVDNS